MRNLTMTAEEAVAWGLANRVVPAEHIRDEALRVAQEIATVGWSSICSSKRLLHAGDPDLFDRLEAERISFVEQITRQDARNGIIDFVEGRN
jgi:enoyl-CoA hydratase/carnithine racemase